MAPTFGRTAQHGPAAWRGIPVAALVLFALFGVSSAVSAEVIRRSSVVVTMPRLAVLEISGDLSGLLSLSPDGVGEASYETGYVASDPAATVLTLNVTGAWDLSARVAGVWTCPSANPKDEADLQIRISNTPTGDIQSGATDFISLGATDTSILSGASGGGPNAVNIQSKVLLDWGQDVPGNYSITVTYTLMGNLP
jgi:hypothetical protein